MVRVDSVQAQRPKTKRDHGACSLRGVSFAPKWHTDPVAKFRVPVCIRNGQPHRTAEFAPGRNRNGKNDGTPRVEIFVCLGKEALCVVFRVWVRNVQSRSGDFVCSGQTHNGWDIFALEGAEQQAGGPQFLRRGHETSLRKAHFTSGRLSRVTVSIKRTWRSSRVTTSECVRMPSPKNRTPRKRFP